MIYISPAKEICHSFCTYNLQLSFKETVQNCFFKRFHSSFFKVHLRCVLLSDLDLDFDLDFTLSHFKITFKLVSKNFQRYVSLKLCTDMHFDGSSSNVCIIIMTLTFSLTLTLPFFIFIERHTYAILNLKDQKYAFCSFKKC